MEPLFKNRKSRLDLFKKLRQAQSSVVAPKDMPENLYQDCPACHDSVLLEDLMKAHYVCPTCGHHLKITARERLRELCDPKSFSELDKRMAMVDSQTFPGYKEKLLDFQKKTGSYEAVITGTCKIQNHKVAICVMDSNFMMGSMGQVVGEKITRCIEHATKKKLPLIIFTTSGGARMQEGILSLVQMAKTSAALAAHKDAGNLYISYLTNPTTGGVSASFAMLGDIILAEPNALVGFAGKRVIESTINETLPPDFQHAEFVLEKGFIDKIVKRKAMRKTLGKLLELHERSAS